MGIAVAPFFLELNEAWTFSSVLLEDPKGNFFIVVWGHVGLAGAREPHVDAVLSLRPRIILSPEIWQKNLSSDYHSSEAIKDS